MYVRTVSNKYGATAVQVVCGSREIEHLESAHHEAELEVLKARGGSGCGRSGGAWPGGLKPGGREGGPLPIRLRLGLIRLLGELHT